jgi:hypothetical protein
VCGFWSFVRPWLGIPDPESGIRKHIPGIPHLFAGVNIPAKIPAQELLAGTKTLFSRIFWASASHSENPAGAAYKHYVNLAQQEVQVARGCLKNLLKDIK